ncbi:MAG: hypothetical protein RID91_09460 [Azospirillaceae bacterium]
MQASSQPLPVPDAGTADGVAQPGEVLAGYWAPAVRARAGALPDRFVATADPAAADFLVVDPPALEALEAEGRPAPLVPVVVVGARAAADELVAAADGTDLAERVEAAAEIARRLRALVRRGTLAAVRSIDALVLAHAWTRGGRVAPRIAGHVAGGRGYPVAGRLDLTAPGDIEHVFDRLVAAGALRAQPVEVGMPCPSCDSLRVLFRDGCVACGSPMIEARALIHHFHCAYQAAEAEFRQASGRYVCPKCGRGLRHFGLDYDKPGEVLHCASCGTEAAEPRAHGRCLDCAATFEADACTRLTIRAFELTPEGARMLHTGAIDTQSVADALSGVFPLVPFATFLVQARTLAAVARRHGLASSVLDLGFEAEAERALAVEDRARLIHHMGTVLSETVRDTDLMSQHRGRVLVLLAGTDETKARQAAERLRRAVAGAVGDRLAGALDTEVRPVDSVTSSEETGAGDSEDAR